MMGAYAFTYRGYMQKTFTLTVTENQLYELNDAANEVITRMLRDGQDETEIKLRALPELWEAFKVISMALLGTTDTPGIREIEPRVLAEIARPTLKRKKQ
mgnify:FL=1